MVTTIFLSDDLREFYARFDDSSILRLMTYDPCAPCRWLYYNTWPTIKLTDDLLIWDTHTTFRVMWLWTLVLVLIGPGMALIYMIFPYQWLLSSSLSQLLIWLVSMCYGSQSYFDIKYQSMFLISLSQVLNLALKSSDCNASLSQIIWLWRLVLVLVWDGSSLIIRIESWYFTTNVHNKFVCSYVGVVYGKWILIKSLMSDHNPSVIWLWKKLPADKFIWRIMVLLRQSGLIGK